MLDLDWFAQHSWAILFSLLAIVIGVEFAFNRSEWKKRSAEVTLVFVGVFVAVVFALAQGKYDREQEGRDKAVTLLKAAEIELSAIMEQNSIYPPDDSDPENKQEKKPPSFNDEKLAKMLARLRNALESKKADGSSTKFPIYEALVKEPEILSRFPPHIMFALSIDYQSVQSLITIKEIRKSTFYPIAFGDEPDSQEQEDRDFIQFLGVYLGEDAWKEFAGARYTFCALRTSIEVDREFDQEIEDSNFWVKQLKKSCGDAKGLPNTGLGGKPYVEGLVDALKYGPR